jgi:uncharacterized protein
MKFILKRALPALLPVLVLFSCASYNKSMDGYYAHVRSHEYDKALRSIEKNKLIQKDRNALLFNMEMGSLYRLQNDPVKSNFYLNRADGMIETNKKTIADFALGNLISPMRQTYLGEDFEQFMLHYYKALNYSSLGLTEDAVVEARRITLSANAQGDKFKNKESRYSKDAFALNLQGMIYEAAGDMNNAFISYRNAADIYLNAGNDYYGVQIPAQLKTDLLRTATSMGFSGERQHYEKTFAVNYKQENNDAGELVLFIEEGSVPVKEEKNFILTTGNNGIGSFNYVDANGYNSNYNFNYNDYGIGAEKLSDLRVMRLALPVYKIQYENNQPITVNNNGNSYTAQLAQNMNSIAVNVLKERFLTEMGNALARQLTKKLVEKGTQAIAESMAKKSDKKTDSTATEEDKKEQKRKQNQKAEATGEVAGFIMNMVNTATEKADTRNWQSLPAYVSYVRIPLHSGENTISINTGAGNRTIKITGSKGLQLLGISAN